VWHGKKKKEVNKKQLPLFFNSAPACLARVPLQGKFVNSNNMVASPQVLVTLLSGKTRCFELSTSPCVEDVLNLVAAEQFIPKDTLRLVCNGRCAVKEDLHHGAFLRCTVTGGLLGGKGGFGAALRSMGKGAGAKKTTDFGACRDLNGRRFIVFFC
jgi:hypothetical protein